MQEAEVLMGIRPCAMNCRESRW